MRKEYFFKDLKEVLSYFKDSKLSIALYFIIQFISNFLGSIFNLFLTLAISIFSKNIILSLIFIGIYLSSDTIKNILQIILCKFEEKMSNIRNIANIKFKNTILYKVRGKVQYKVDGVMVEMPENIILETLEEHFNFF